MDVFICLCGTQAGYPHHPCCPRPLFQANDATEALWQKDFDSNKRLLAMAESDRDEKLIDAGHQHYKIKA